MGLFAGLAAVTMVVSMFALSRAGDVSYDDVTLSGGFESGHFDDVWDLTDGDIAISFTYDANGMVDDTGAHAWAELGVRSLGSNGDDFNPYNWYSYPGTVKKPLVATSEEIKVGEFLFKFDPTTDEVILKFRLYEPWLLVTTHAIVEDSMDDIPVTNSGNPILGHFPCYTNHDPYVSEFKYEVDASEWVTDCPPVLYVAAHAEIVDISGDEAVFESAWAAKNDFPGANSRANYFWVDPVMFAGSGVWLATDYDWAAGTFDPDPVGAPTLDMDDKLILQRVSGQGEGAYDLPSTPPSPGDNHRVWFDRDGVDQWQATAPLAVDGGTYNTAGIYQITITLHANDATTGTAYLTINGLSQGFETDGNWNTMELTPAGMTFVGDMHHLVVFYGIYGYGATHSAEFSDITVSQ
jgi:hypothetical protein